VRFYSIKTKKEVKQLNKKLLLIPLALLLALSLIAIGCPTTTPTTTPATTAPPTTQPPPAKDKIVIGQAIALSGALVGGVQTAGGPVYELWVDEVNKDGGIYVEEYGKKLPVELIRYDDESDIGKMTDLLEKLILEDQVDFVLPPWGTAWLFAAAPIANKYGYILIGGPGGALELKSLNLPYFFQVLNFSETQAPALTGIYSEVGVESVAIIFRGDLHGVEYGGALVPYFETAGIDVAMIESYPPDVTEDFSPLLKEAQSLGVDAFLAACYPWETGPMTGQAIGYGINFDAIWFSVGPYCPNTYRDAFGAEVIEGVMGGGAWNAKTSAGAAEFVDKYIAFTGMEPDYWGGLYYYSSLQHFQQAIEKAGTLDQAVIRDIMAADTFETALGPFWYDANRYFANHPGEIGQWQSGVFEVVDPGDKRTAPPLYPKPDWPAP
jgi:branched-chain amino acid transport system substrate-binding protein